jgi:hypothetical protein
VEYAGDYAPLPLIAAIVIQQPTLARSNSDYIIKATFAAPAISRPSLSMRIDVGHLPWITASCSVEGLPVSIVEFKAPDNTLTFPIPMEWSRHEHTGILPLPLPHVTVVCAFSLGSNSKIHTAAAPAFDVWVHDGEREVARGRARLQSLSDAVEAVRVGLSIEHSALEGEKLGLVFNSVVDVLVKHYDSGYTADHVSLVSQTHPSSGHSLLTFEIISQDTSRTVTVDGIKAISGHFVAALQTLGYTVTNNPSESISSRLMDAACAYQCGSGCNPCADMSTCVWDLDCSGGECKDGVCRTPSPPPMDLTWLWASIAGLVCIVIGFLIYRFGCPYLRATIQKNTREALLSDMDEFNDVEMS